MQIGKSTIPDRVSDPALAAANAQNPALGQGAGFDRLVGAAQAEADRRQAIAARSGANADGFTDQAWLEAMKTHGSEIGLGSYANAIKSDSRGQLLVADSAMRQRILAYRNDPTIRAVMAVKRAGSARTGLTNELGRAPTDQEMRAADVLGTKSAARLILTRQGTPLSSAAIAAPEAAEANHALFYRADGSPLTVNEVLQRVMAPQAAASQPGTPVVTPSSVTAGQPIPADVMQALQSRANFASAAAQNPAAPQQRRPVAPPRDLPLVGGTLGNLSMPGNTNGAPGATGGRLGGWRGQMAGEVLTQVTRPDQTVQNAPSNVTIPAPQRTRYIAANEVHRPTTPVAGVGQSATLLGPDLAQAQRNAVTQAPAVAGPTGAPQSAPLPSLIVEGQARPPANMPADALALLPVGQQPLGVPAPASGTPQTLAPLQAQANSAANPAPIGQSLSQSQSATATAQTEAAPERPSRYGPRANASAPATRAGPVLNYAEAGQAQGDVPDASAAGIRTSRYSASPASAAQQYAAMARMATPQPTEPVASGFVDANGNTLLPPVPGINGLPPLTAAEALRAGPVAVAPNGPVPPRPIGPTEAERVAALEGTKPLDLAPDAPVLAAAEAPVAVASAPQPANRSRPRTIPPFMYNR